MCSLKLAFAVRLGKYLLISTLFLFTSTATGQNGQNGGVRTDRRARSAICELPLELGNCTRKFTRFYFDSDKGHCFKFIFTGCGGNANRFLTRQQCKRTCHPKRRKHKKTRVSARLLMAQNQERERQLACLSNCTNGACVHGECQCKRGFERRGNHCVDSDECHWIDCAENAVCVNIPGSFRCECRKGFAGSGFNCTKERRICAQWFDPRYEQQCQHEQEWLPRFYYHIHSGECRRFWYGGCQFGDSQNFFLDENSCDSVCHGYSHEEFFTDVGLMKEHSSMNGPLDPKPPKMDWYRNSLPSDGPCMDKFNESFRFPCTESIWKRRYYYDAEIGRCQMFWMDSSCPSPRMEGRMSRNIFVHLSICRRACEGTDANANGGGEIELKRWQEWEAWNSGRNRSTGVIQASFGRSTSSTATTTTMASTAANGQQQQQVVDGGGEEEDCGLIRMSDQLAHSNSAQEKQERLARLKMKLSGKHMRRKHKQKTKQYSMGQSDACFDQFDWELIKSCGKGPWRTRFFYDQRHGKCRPFWNDGCRGETRNNFRNEGICQNKCEREELSMKMSELGLGQQQNWTGPQFGTICAQIFDNNYRRACNNGRTWRRKWFFDGSSGFCRHFWYDGCAGITGNIFDGLKECMNLCVHDPDISRQNSLISHRQNADQQIYAYFAESEPASMGHWATSKNYLKSADLWLEERQCTSFRYNATGTACLRAFLCLMEEGGGCQRTVHLATNGAEKCHSERPWLKGRHLYSWFFTMDKHPTSLLDNVDRSSIDAESDSDKSSFEIRQRPTASAVLTLRQRHLNVTNSAILPIQPFGQHNGTVAWVDLVDPAQCNAELECQ